jgi:hypothetical protein
MAAVPGNIIPVMKAVQYHWLVPCRRNANTGVEIDRMHTIRTQIMRIGNEAESAVEKG